MPTFNDIACPVCGCVCDDLTLTTDGTRVVRAERACALAEPWFMAQSSATRPDAEIEGSPTDVAAAIARAVELLRLADNPLIYGLSRSSTGGQRAAVKLAEQIGATIDTTASLCHGPSIMAVQAVGESTCSLGEIRTRADLVIFWGCNPAETHPRHAERYSVFPRSEWLPNGRADRTVVMIGDAREVHDWRLDRAGAQADWVIPIEPDRDLEAITTLRCLIKDVVPTDTSSSWSTGPQTGDVIITPPSLPRWNQASALRATQPQIVFDVVQKPASHRDKLGGVACSRTSGKSSGHVNHDLVELAERMKSCRCGVVFFGLGLTASELNRSPRSAGLGHLNVEVLLRLVAELNDHTRFHARRMRLHGDVTGADSVLCWQTGYPFSVNLSRGYPRYNPGEFSANDLLTRGEPDLCVIIGSETLPQFTPPALDHLRRIPTILLDYPAAESIITPSVRITTAPYGLHAPGTAYRMDEVPIPFKASLPTHLPTDEVVLHEVAQRLELSLSVATTP